MPSFLIVVLRGLLGLCPNCGQASMFKGLFSLHTHCPHCGIEFENQVGDFTGAVHISATLIAGFAMVLGVATLWFFKLSVLAVILLDTPFIILFGLLLHRLVKGMWTSLMIYTRALETPAPDDYWGQVLRVAHEEDYRF